MVADLLLMLNPLKSVDIIFFIVCAVAIAVGVAIYFLIPVFNKKQYQEQRENLKAREEAFNRNKPNNNQNNATDGKTVENTDKQA